MSNFFSSLNIRQFIVHFVASWFFIYAFHTVAYLYDYKILSSDNVNLYKVMFKQRFITDMFIIGTAGSIGLFVAYTISWRLSLKNNWFWATPAVVFLFTFLLFYFNLLGWSKLQYIFLAPGQLFSAFSNFITILVNGVIMLAIGLFLFLNKKIIAYINKGVKAQDIIIKKYD